MLRLWPERLYTGVFPDCGWLHRGGAHEPIRFDDAAGGGRDLMAGIETLLAERAWPRKGRVELVVSDHFARLVHLPWQSGLSNEAQRSAYGHACFERAGLGLEGKWLLQTAYRHFATDGIAYALPRELVAQVRDYLAARDLKLSSILPLSGAAYWRHGRGLGRTRNVLLLEESRRVSAMLFDHRKYVGMQVQPFGVVPADALRRLLSSVDAVFPGVKQIRYWSAKEIIGRQDLIKERLPDAALEVLPILRWH